MRLVILVVVVGLALAPAAAAQAPAVNTFVYEGKLDGSNAQGSHVTTAHIDWKVIGSSPANDPSVVSWEITELSGTVTDSGTSAAPSCHGVLSLDPGYHVAFAPLIHTTPGQPGYEFSAYNPADTTESTGSPAAFQIQSSAPDTTPCGDNPPYALRSIEGYAHNASGAMFGAVMRPRLVFAPGFTVTRVDFSPPVDETDPFGDYHYFSVSSSVSFKSADAPTDIPPPTTPGAPPPGPGPGPFAKFAAAADVVLLWPQVVSECGAVLYPEHRLSRMLAFLLGPVLDELCEEDVRRLIDDVLIIDDPPDPRVHEVARPVAVKGAGVRLRSCPRKGRPAKLCRAVRPKLLRYVTAARKIRATADALSTTINRYAAAKAAGDEPAVALQTQAADELTTTMQAQVASRKMLGSRIARRVAKAGVHVRNTKAQSRKSIARLLRRLGKRGITEATVRALLDAKALEPSAGDVLGRL